MNKIKQSNRVNDLMLEVIDLQSSPNNDQTFKTKTTTTTRSESDTENDDSTDKNSESILPKTCILRTIVFIVVTGILFGILFATGVLKNEDISGIPILGDVDFEGFFDSDPFGGLVTPQNPEAAYRWPNPQQSGLQLMVLNALTDDWQQEFETAMAQWDAGQPDTLTLQSERVAVDVQCEPIDGILKVCNGNYGATDWRGLNVVLLDMEGRWIYSSTAKMNEYFLARASLPQRQYTMCHELGHGFGLPHWDTNFYNANMGNCMDYTNRPRSNMQPDTSNFNFLKELYGEVGATIQPAAPSQQQQQGPAMGWNNNPPNENNAEGEEEETDEEGNERFLLRGSRLQSITGDIPDFIMSAYRSILNGETLVGHSRRILHSDDDGEGILIDLGYSNYGLLVYKLRPIDQNDEE